MNPIYGDPGNRDTAYFLRYYKMKFAEISGTSPYQKRFRKCLQEQKVLFRQMKRDLKIDMTTIANSTPT